MTKNDAARLHRIRQGLERAPPMVQAWAMEKYRDLTGLDYFDWSFVRDNRVIAKELDLIVGPWGRPTVVEEVVE